MSAIIQALGSGYNARQILSYLSQHNPQLAAQVSSALNAGHTIEHVLNFISRNEKKMGKLTPEKAQQGNIYKQAQSSIHPSLTGMAKFAGTAALAAGGAFALSRAAPQILQRGLAAGSNLPIQPSQSPIQPTQPPQNTGITPNSNLAPLGNSNASQLQQNQPQVLNQASQSPAQNVNNVSSVTQSQPIAQPEVKINPKEYLEKLGIQDKVDDLLNRGNSPEQAAATLGMQRGAGKVSGQIDPELLANIDAYAKEPKPEKVQSQLQETKELPIEEKQPEEVKSIAKNEIVSSPHGVGEVKEIRNGQAIIDVDGKLHKVKEDELEAEPEEVREAKFDFNPDEVPEDLRSAPLNEVYTPADRRHVTVKFNAGLKPIRYLYYRKDGQPISEEYFDKIKKGVQLPVSSGKSFWGTWRADESDSRGAANYEELVSNAQEEGEPDDPSKEYWFVKEEAVYEHPYMEKAGKEQLRAMEKAFNEKNKKPRKKKKA